MKDESQDTFVGRILAGRYRITECLAKGGMGVVYKGERLQLGRPVAIKFLLETLSDSPEFLARFEREAKAMSQLSHPNCVSVIDYGIEDAPFIVMDFVTGNTLRQILDEGLVDTGRAVHIAKQLLASLAHAHNQGIIHRDIKPDNIMLSEATGMGDHVRIFDFGLAKLMDLGSENNLSRTDMAMGTPGYMSPEQTIGNPADARSDLYSTGVVLFEMLTGRKPFIEDNPFKVMLMHRDAAPPTLNMAAPGKLFSRELEIVVATALEKDPDRRYSSAKKFAEALVTAPESKLAPIAFETPSDTGVPATRSDMMATASMRVTPGQPLQSPGGACGHEDETSRPFDPHGLPAVRSRVEGNRFIVWVMVLFMALAVLGLGIFFRDRVIGPFSSTLTEAASKSMDALAARKNSTDNPLDDDDIIDLQDLPAVENQDSSGQHGGSTDEDSGLEKVKELIEAKQYEEAITALRTLRQANPNKAIYPYMMAEVFFEKHWLKDSIDFYREAIKLNPGLRGRKTMNENLIAMLDVDQVSPRARVTLLEHIGRPALPYLRRAAKSDESAKVRRRASSIASSLSPSSSKAKTKGKKRSRKR
jgi:serine/threonine-protein kinase